LPLADSAVDNPRKIMKKTSNSVSGKKSSKLSNSFSSFTGYLGEQWTPLIESHNETIKFKAGELVFKEGEKVPGMYCLNTGKVKIYSEDNNEEHILRLAGDGELVGLRGIGKELIYAASCIALTDCEMSFLPINIFLSLLRTNSEFCYYYMNLISEELRRTEMVIRKISRMEMKERIAYAIVRNLDAFGYERDEKGLLSYTLSRKEYASMASTTYETVIRMLSDLEKNKFIRLERKNIRILNENGLRKLLNGK
jgi:CRP/FNR family transcriptional regulator